MMIMMCTEYGNFLPGLRAYVWRRGLVKVRAHSFHNIFFIRLLLERRATL
jgi:hypothetical protein